MTGERWEPAPEIDAGPNEDEPATPSAGERGADADGTSHVYHLDAGESLCVGVVSAVAAVTGRTPRSLAPLYDTIDPDALASLVGDSGTDAGDPSVRIAFTYAGTAVTVESTGRIILRR